MKEVSDKNIQVERFKDEIWIYKSWMNTHTHKLGINFGSHLSTERKPKDFFLPSGIQSYNLIHCSE